MSHTKEEKIKALGRIIDTLDELRVKCPWDRKQTNESLRPNTIEEVYELCDALICDDSVNIKKELGVVFQNSVLDKPLSVYDNLESRAALYGILGDEFKSRLSELSEILDFNISDNFFNIRLKYRLIDSSLYKF